MKREGLGGVAALSYAASPIGNLKLADRAIPYGNILWWVKI